MILELIRNKTMLDIDYIENVINKANISYSSFCIPKPNGSMRRIYQPKKELKLIQKIINDNLLIKLKVHQSSKAYSKGCCVYKNALMHVNNNFLLRMDFKDFFTSISAEDIRHFMNLNNSDVFGTQWTKEDIEIFINIVCYKDHLVMGAVTSPSISNAICYELDMKIFNLCREKNIIYSRYADDLYFSTSDRNILLPLEKDIMSIVSNLDFPKKLQINNKKTFHSSRKRRKNITGLIVTSDGKISIGRDKKRKIRSWIYNWDQLDNELRTYISGYVSYVKSVEPSYINSLFMKYGADLMNQVMKYNSCNNS